MSQNTHGADAPAAPTPNEPRRLAFSACAPRTQRGAIAIMLGVLLPVILGIVGVSLELAQLYNRKVEMQAIADAIAISAAKQLNGTADGISNAVAAARDIVESGYDWTRLKHGYRSSITFSEAAISFGSAPDGNTWVGVDAAKAAPDGLAYVHVDTDGLGEYGKVELLLMPVLSTLTSVQVGHRTIAGRQQLKATPLAICDMSADPENPIQERNNGTGFSELTEYGFRRGVSYNLLKLNPKGETAAHYLVDPIALSPKGVSSNFKKETAGQYICSGTVELPAVVGEAIHLQTGFPIDKFANHLNARFDLSKGDCSPISAPPDSNIKQFTIASNTWMSKPKSQVAESFTSPGLLHTIADLPPPNEQDPTLYGPLWAFARAVPWTSYAKGEPEPAKGYTAFPATAATWKGLYKTGPGMNTYPAGPTTLSTPYFTQVTAPAVSPPGIQYRRILNVPLLKCPVSGAAGTVVAMARFFMTVPADANGIYAEFAGIATREEFAGPVELYQ